MGKLEEFSSLMEMREFFQRAGQRGGKIGGRARAAKLSPKRRREIAKKAAAASAKARSAKAKAKKRASVNKKVTE